MAEEYYEKKYKEALERARDLVSKDNVEVAEYIFPELTDVNDEKIRKALVRFHRSTIDIDGIKGVDILAWLEKQGKSSDQIHYWTEEEIEPIISDYLRGAEHYGGMIGRLRCLKPKSLEKQGEQKHINDTDEEIVNAVKDTSVLDMVEPKFKVGDYIVYDYCMGRVVEITNDAYLLDIGQGIPFSCEDNVHLWTIKDANEGNIIAGKIDGDNYIFIFKTIKDGWIETYGHYYNAVDRFCVPSQLFCRDYQGTFTPATKEQRDLLFTKMEEAGYQWDADKKELKKVGWKLTELAKGEDYGKCWKPSIDVDTMVEEYVKQYAYIDMRSCDSIRKVYREGILNTLDKINK